MSLDIRAADTFDEHGHDELACELEHYDETTDVRHGIEECVHIASVGCRLVDHTEQERDRPFGWPSLVLACTHLEEGVFILVKAETVRASLIL